MILMRFFLVLAPLSAMALQGCPGPTVALQPTYSSLSKNVFVGCSTSSCHGQGRRGNLVLTQDRGYAELVGVAPDNDQARKDGLLRVSPGNPDQSFLLIKLDHPKTGYGDRMPLFQDPLSPAEIAAIRAWIAQGAPNN